MRKFATVLALSLAATHGLPTPRSSIAKKDEAKDVDASRFLSGFLRGNKKHRTKFRVQFLPLASAALTVINCFIYVTKTQLRKQ